MKSTNYILSWLYCYGACNPWRKVKKFNSLKQVYAFIKKEGITRKDKPILKMQEINTKRISVNVPKRLSDECYVSSKLGN